jgi:hypothetical protein
VSVQYIYSPIQTPSIVINTRDSINISFTGCEVRWLWSALSFALQCSVVRKIPRCFGGIYLLPFQIRKISQARYWHETGGSVLKMEAQMSSARRLLLQVSSLAYSSISKMVAICSSETSGGLRTSRRYNAESHTLKLNLFINIYYFWVVKIG